MSVTKLILAVLEGFKSRVPSSKQILTVYSFVLFIAAGWSIYSFLFNLPSSLYYFNTFQIISVFSYVMAFTLFESILVLLALVAIGIVLPGKWFRDCFTYSGPLVILVGGVASVRLQDSMRTGIPPLRWVAVGALLVLIACVVLIWLFHKVTALQKIFLKVVEQFVIFAYIYVPLGLLGMVIVLVRNVLQ